jgi:[methyl-Co(III) methylamine-specific corrinoid protein]:coenzyme M methyltransferase
MNARERLLAVLDGRTVDRVPVISHLQTGTVDLMNASGAYWPEANHNSDKMVALALAAHTVAGLESVKVPFDVALDCTAFGVQTGNEAMDRPPSVLRPIITNIEDIDRMETPNPHQDGRPPLVLEALQKLKEKKLDVPIIGGVIAPFSLAGQMRGEQDAIMDVLLHPELITKLLERTAEWGAIYARAELEAGADVITLVDATASGTILSPQHYAEFVLPYQQKVMKAIHDRGGKAILHICGDVTHNLDLMLQTGADGISVDQVMDMRWVKERTKGRCAAVGNISPTTTLLLSSPLCVRKTCRGILEAGTDVLAPGCGIAPRTPLANLQAMASLAGDISTDEGGPEPMCQG